MKQGDYKRLSLKILGSMILVPVIPFVLVVFVGLHYFASSLETETVSKMTRIAEDHRKTIELFLAERRADLRFIADSHTFDDLSEPDFLKKVFFRLQRKSGAFVDLGLFDKDGIHKAYHGPYQLKGKEYKEAEWFKEVMNKGYYVSDVFLGYRQVPHFVIAIAQSREENPWVIRATIDTLLFNDIVERVRMGKTGEAYILNKNGQFQTQRRSGGNLMEQEKDSWMSLETHSGTKTFVEKDTSGEAYLYAVTWLKDNQWLLVVRQEKSDAFHALRSATYIVILISILGGVSIIAMAFYMTTRIVSNMRRMDTEKTQLSQQLIIASRLAEIGEMSAGFAHEINNPLQIINAEQTLIETIIQELKENGELRDSEELKELEDSLRQIRVQTDRCGGITQALLKFARDKETAPAAVDLNRFLPEVIGLVIRKADVEGIDVRQAVSDDIPLIYVDTSQLQQVLVNLLNNAIFAIVERHGAAGGKLKVSAKAADGRVEIAVTDNGNGISPENMKKIFTPFFTTKPVGKGTGLGLSVCYSIVEKMGGVLGVQSEQGKGATFTIHLPAEK
ncbi:MAG: ATP-binding protein [Thermodesulfobacteriota bacterium]|nr:ATP-binding protein [Thermodesulfobacteriota bacterium]